MKPVMQAIAAHSMLELQVIATGTMVLERFDQPVRVVKADGFELAGEVFIELEGSTPTTMAKSVGFAIIELAGELRRLQPDIVLIIGDRYEALAAAVAAAYMNITIAHIQGGEVSGSIDESARHAISKLAHFHFPSTERAASYLKRMGEKPETILAIGCPSSDIAATAELRLAPEVINSRGRGATIDPDQPFLLVVFHPTTTEYGDERDQMEILLAALAEIRLPTVLLWPNIDAGADHISKAIRVFRDQSHLSWLRTIVNLSPEHYLQVLANAACAIGNSSSFVRDASFFGTPVVLVGSRQDGRETDRHVHRVAVSCDKITASARAQLAHGSYPSSILYGDGQVSGRIADALATLTPYIQKRLSYALENDRLFMPGASDEQD
jgi:UDP-hydrolysing UDP-N-acetyl-D-glucosamine 2-epimerase